MPKVSRAVLKDLVKECLVEILAEGISPSNPKRSKAASRKRPSSTKPSDRDVVNESFEANIDNAVSGMTNDPVLASIFADTARTTLQDQSSADSRGSNASMLSAGQDDHLDEAFDNETSQNWQRLAFAEKKS